MILHIVSPHNWTKEFLNYFEENIPHNNAVVCLFDDGRVEYSNGEITETYLNAGAIENKIKLLDISVAVVQHLTPIKKSFIVKYLPARIPIVWWMFGADLYNRFLSKKGYELYAPQTLPFLKCTIPHQIKRDLFYLRERYYEAIILKRVIGVIPCDMPDYKLACEVIGRPVDLVFVTPYQDILNLPLCTGHDILVCHSASLTNNHLYALDYMRKWEIGESEIYIPLSYNIQSESYCTAVIEGFRETFGEKTHCLLEFESYNSYINRFLKYKIAVFATWRQEALGNIEICFQIGVKVMMSKHNPYYLYFKSIGLKVFALEEVETKNDLEPLSEEDKIHNREVFYQIISERKERFINDIKTYFSKFI